MYSNSSKSNGKSATPWGSIKKIVGVLKFSYIKIQLRKRILAAFSCFTLLEYPSRLKVTFSHQTP